MLDFAGIDCRRLLVNAKPNEVFFTSGGTESDNWAVFGGAYAQKAVGRTHIITTMIEHHAVKAAVEKLEKEGFSVTWLPVNDRGMVEVNTLKAALTDKTGIVAVMLANNETGVLQDVKAFAQIAHENGSIFRSEKLTNVFSFRFGKFF